MNIDIREFLELKLGDDFKHQEFDKDDLEHLIHEWEYLRNASNVKFHLNPRSKTYAFIDTDKGIIIGHFKKTTPLIKRLKTQ